MNEDLVKRKNTLWKNWEEKLGKRIPQDVRAHFEADVETGPDEDVALLDLNGLIEETIERAALLNGVEKYFSGRSKPKVMSTKRYQRSFEKRVYLVKFVLATQRFFPRKRIDWERVCSEWNMAHPNDLFTKEVIKVRYYRAIAEKDIKQIYLNEIEAMIIEQLVELFGDVNKARPIIDLFKSALRYVEEAEEIQENDEEEADNKKIKSMELTTQAIDAIKRQVELKKNLRAKEAHNERSHTSEG